MPITIVDLTRRINHIERLVNYSLTTGGGGGGSASWGSITGTLSNQTDLNTALAGKSSTSHSHNVADLSAASFPTGSILFSNGVNLAQHSAMLFFDDTNERIGLRTNAPTHTFTVGNGGNGVALYSTTDQVTNYQRIVLSSTSVNAWTLDTQKAGTGTLIGGFYIASAGTVQMGWDGTQIVAYKNFIPISNNSLDIGRHTSALKFRSMFLGTSLSVDVTGAPTAKIHLGAGSATAGTAPIKLTTGVALATPEDGAMEYHNSHLYFTIGSTRYQLDQQSSTTSWGSITGTLSSQTDLQTALDAKLDSSQADSMNAAIAALGGTIKYSTVGVPISAFGSNYTLVSGTIRWLAVWISKTTTLTGGATFLKTTGDYVASDFNGYALYSYSGGTLTQVAVTANTPDMYKGGTNTWVKVPFTSTYNAAPGLYYFAYIFCASGTPTVFPVVASAANLTSVNLYSDIGKLYGFNTAQTALPASQSLASVSSNQGVTLVALY